MKTYRSLLISLLILAAACNKEEIQKQQPVAANDVENAAVTKTKILTAKPWRYQKLTYNYNPTTKTGQVVYLRSRATNTVHVGDVKVYYKTAGGYDEIDSVGTHHPGTWKFTGPTQDTVQITYTGNPTPLKYVVQALSATNYNVLYRVGNTLRLAAFVRVPNGQ